MQNTMSTRTGIILATNALFQFAEALQQHTIHQHTIQVATGGPTYGTNCPCIGIEGLTGNTAVVIDNTTYPDRYPAEIGSRCEAWDEGKYPGYCDGKNASDWCSQAWCYVDVDNCELEDGPYETDYLPYGQFRGHALYYSYLTCGSTNTYDLHQQHSKARTHTRGNRQISLAEDGHASVAVMHGVSYGVEKCQCIGIEGLSGNTAVVVDNTTYPDRYPAEIGSRCEAWDEGKYPGSCDGNQAEEWCTQAWCYVDVQHCELEDGPYESDYLPYADFHGYGLYYSYLTCNGTNTYDLYRKSKQIAHKNEKH